MKIMIVDDDTTNRIVLKSLLDRQKHDVVMADNGSVAIKVFESELPDMILMDVIMPVMDGLEAAKVIKHKCVDKFVPIIFLTAMSEADNMVRCIEAGGDDVMTKPYNGAVLCAKIEAFTRIRNLYQTVQQQKHELAIFRDNTQQGQIVAEKIFANIMSRGDLHLNMLKSLKNPAETLNGDIVLTARNPSGGLNILVGDFTGHGLAAAIGAMPVADIFYGMSLKGFNIEDIIPELNRKLRSTLPLGRFLAAVLMHVDAEGCVLSIWNGGMPDVLMYRYDKQSVTESIAATRLPLGVVDNAQLETEVSHYEINTYDRIYVYSDGVTEQQNMAGVMFGEERLIREIELVSNECDVVDRIGKILAEYRQGKEQADDVTLLEVTIDPEEMATLPSKTQQEPTIPPATCWKLSLEFGPDTLKRIDPLPMVIQLTTDIQGLNSHRENLYVVLSELFNNALDHGLLALDSKMKSDALGFASFYVEREQRLKGLTQGFISIAIEHEPKTSGGGRVIINVKDSGAGFDYKRLSVSLQENNGHSGRGIPLLLTLCSSVEYFGNGNTVKAVYQWE